MKNQTSFFIIFCLALASMVLGGYSVFLRYFGEGTVYKAQIAKLEREVSKEKFKNELLGNQIVDIQQSVAELLPDEKQLQAKVGLKDFSDNIRMPSSESQIDLSGVIYARAEKFFSEKKFDEAIKTFKELMEKYPLSQHVVKSKYFIVESYFLKTDYKAALTAIDEMVVMYPENDLTGYALIRMGQISELNNQLDEAAEVYKTVQEHFSNPHLVENAKKQAERIKVSEE